MQEFKRILDLAGMYKRGGVKGLDNLFFSTGFQIVAILVTLHGSENELNVIQTAKTQKNWSAAGSSAPRLSFSDTLGLH